jgi:imidazole glycerol-phosphate synthase subunit HisF
MKRIIFTLLYSDGSYMLSRNFRLQRVGDLDWVLRNYRIRDVSLGIDELMILDVSSDAGTRDRFRNEVSTLARECFVPLTVGGHVTSVEEAQRLFELGADKILMNTALTRDPTLIEDLAGVFGNQAIVAGIDVCADVTRVEGVRVDRMTRPEDVAAQMHAALSLGAGEILLQSVDRDGTGNGLDLGSLADLGGFSAPLIVMGGVGRASHVIDGLRCDAVDAVATANLFNFVGDTLLETRRAAVGSGVELPMWESADMEQLEAAFERAHGSRGNDAGVEVDTDRG